MSVFPAAKPVQGNGTEKKREDGERERERRRSEVILKRKSMLLLPGRLLAAAAERSWPRQPIARSVHLVSPVSRYIIGLAARSWSRAVRLPVRPPYASVASSFFCAATRSPSVCRTPSGHHKGIHWPTQDRSHDPPTWYIMRACRRIRIRSSIALGEIKEPLSLSARVSE